VIVRSRVQVLETTSCVKNRIRLLTIHQKWWNPFPGPAYAGDLRSVRFEVFGRVERGGSILMFSFLVELLRGKGCEGEGSKTHPRFIYCFPPNLSFLEGRGDELLQF